MIEIEKGNESKIILDFAKKTFSLLAQRKYQDFLEQFDSSALSKENIYLALRSGDENHKELILNDPAFAECKNVKRIVTEVKEGYHLSYDLAIVTKSCKLTGDIIFIIDQDMFYVILEDLYTWNK